MENAPKNTREVNGAYQIDYAALVADYKLAYDVKDEQGNYVNADYYHVGTVNGLEYYTPNDEDWGYIIVVDNENKLAAETGFYEMDDIYPGSDYAFTAHNGGLVPLFTI